MQKYWKKIWKQWKTYSENYNYKNLFAKKIILTTMILYYILNKKNYEKIIISYILTSYNDVN